MSTRNDDYDPTMGALLYIWCRTGGRSAPIPGTLGALVKRTMDLPKEGVYSVEIETNHGRRLDWEGIRQLAGPR